MCHGPFFLMEPLDPVLPGEGRWLTDEASAQASEETGVQLDPVQARLDELLRRLESQESLIRTLQATQVALNEGRQKQNHCNNLTMRGGMGMINGLVKAGAKAGTIGRIRLGATPSQRTIPRLCPR